MAFDPTTLDISQFRSDTVNGILDSLLGLAETEALTATAQGTATQEGVLVSFEAPASATLGANEKTIFCWLFPDAKSPESDEPSVLLFYQPALASEDTSGLLPEGSAAQPLLSAVTSGTAYWLFYSSVEGYSVPEQLIAALPEATKATLPPILTDRRLSRGSSLQNTVQATEIESAFHLPDIIPFAGSSLWLSFGESSLRFSVALSGIPTEKWLGDNLIFKQLEVGIISSYQEDLISFTQIYLAAQISLWDQPASFVAQLDIEDSSPRGMSFEIHPGLSIDVAGGLTKLGELMSGASLNIPDQIPHPNISIQSLRGYINFTNGLASLSGAVSCSFGDSGWSPFGNGGESLFSLQEVGVSFSWQQGIPVNWTIAGEVMLATYQLQASYAHPAQIISAELAPSNESKGDISGFLTGTLGLPEGASGIVASALTAVDLSLYYDRGSQELELGVRNHEAWQLVPDILTVSTMDLRIMRTAGAFNYAELYFELQLPIGADQAIVEIDIEGVYDATGETALWTFEGDIDQAIAIGDLIAGLADKFKPKAAEVPEVPEVPEEIHHLFAEDLSVNISRSAEELSFQFSGSLVYEWDETESLSLSLLVEVQKEGGSWDIHLATTLEVAGYQLALEFAKDNTSKTLLAALTSANSQVEVGAFLSEYAPEDLRDFIPELSIGLKDAFVGFYKKSTEPAKTKASTPGASKESSGGFSVVMALDIDLGSGLDFSALPVVGEMLKDQSLGIQNLRVLACTRNMEPAGLAALNTLLGGHGVNSIQSKADSPDGPFKKGIYLSASIEVPGLPQGIPIHASFTQKEPSATKPASDSPSQGKAQEKAPSTSSQTGTPTKARPATQQSNTGISPVGKQIGPFFLESVSLGLEDGKAKVEFSGGFVMGPIGMEVIGFSVRSPLDKFSPEFDLRGFAIGFDKPPITIAGLLVKNFYKDDKGLEVREYIGAISIGIKAFSLVAIGAYAEVGSGKDAFKSMFIYGFLGAPLGGPAFFFVTGLAAGFGYNRQLNTPAIDQIDNFPLVAVAKKPLGQALNMQDLKDIQENLITYRSIPPSKGDYWFALGIRFESFKMISSFVVIAIKFGHELEINLMGISTMTFPLSIDPKVPALAVIKIGLLARILPERGIVDVRGAILPGTYILDPDVHITGGFAMLAIMKDQDDGEWKGGKAGEFIITVGGYGPWYKPKPYYPVIPRLALHWQVLPQLKIEASAYFAITPEAMMVGGYLRGNFHQGGTFSVDVVFGIGIDFIIYWQPLSYRARAHAEFKVRASADLLVETVHLDLDLSAEMEIWGPEFAGYATIKINAIVSFSATVEFGPSAQTHDPLTWDQFRQSLLPESDKVVSISIGKGLVPGNSTIPVLNPKEASFLINSSIPAKSTNQAVDISKTDFGIKTMGLTHEDLRDSKLLVSVKKGTEEVNAMFDCFPVYKNMPSAMWESANESGKLSTESNGELVEKLLAGFEMKAKPPKPSDSYTLETAEIQDVITGRADAWNTPKLDLSLLGDNNSKPQYELADLLT